MRLIFLPPMPIQVDMKEKRFTPVVRCAYIKSSYLAEKLQCFGYKTDCPLYQKSNGEYYSKASFDAAMDQLIVRTKNKHASKSEPSK